MKLLELKFDEIHKMPRKKKKVHVQAQKYNLVPKWRRRPGGRKGQMR